MNIQCMRTEISKIYAGKSWTTKVKYMPDAQVLAVYYSFLKNDRFKKEKIESKCCGMNARQITLDELF